MKIFISHQRADSPIAQAIERRLRIIHQIDCYLDVIDPDASQAGNDLGEYIRSQLARCTHLLAVVSENTKKSWWVPWEIGISTEKDQPIATYAGGQAALPEYLRKWPYLRNESDLDDYASVSKSSNTTFALRKLHIGEAAARRSTTSDFYKNLRARLGQ